MGQQTVMRSFKSFGEAFDLQETIGQFIGTIDLVSDFMYVLEDLAEQQKKRDTDTKHLLPSQDGTIAFQDVDIVSPAGNCCVYNLNFVVKPGKSLMVTGPNASGKSSLFRTMGGLWTIPTGQIKRPVDAKSKIVTPKQIFLVPQKPYSSQGSLADQITYPDVVEKRSAQEEALLLSLLTLCGIQYLVDRNEKGWDHVQKWEDTLSLGEQQRIGMARLFYHQPRFAILDECTSAVSIDIEKRLYDEASKLNITSITVSQRLALTEYHDTELRLGDCEGEDGWSIHKILTE